MLDVCILGVCASNEVYLVLTKHRHRDKRRLQALGGVLITETHRVIFNCDALVTSNDFDPSLVTSAFCGTDPGHRTNYEVTDNPVYILRMILTSYCSYARSAQPGPESDQAVLAVVNCKAGDWMIFGPIGN